MEKIIINGLKVFGYHGCIKEERKTGTDFVVDIELTANLLKAAKKDSLKDTIDYARVSEITKEEMAKTHDLIETLSLNILNALFREFLKLKKATVKITKMNPPVSGDLTSVSVVMSKRKK